MNQQRPLFQAVLRIRRIWSPVVVVMVAGFQLQAEDLIPPPVIVLPPVIIPQPPEDDEVPVAEPVIIPEFFLLGDGVDGDIEVDGAVEPPEIAAPHSPAKPAALILRWHQYRTLVVIDTSIGLVKPCWIVTLSTVPEEVDDGRKKVTVARGQVVVAYRGKAYHDKDGILHIDARRALLSGILADNWSPDSFSITPSGQVTARDDNPNHNSNSGEIEKEVSAESQKEEYRRLMFTAQTLVDGSL